MKPWAEILAELRGARLAVYDALLTRGEQGVNALGQTAAPYKGEEIEEALGWLCAAQFIREVTAGSYRARQPADAQKQYSAAGGLINEFMRGRVGKEARGEKSERTDVAPAPIYKPANAAPEGRRVHDYQVQLFADV